MSICQGFVSCCELVHTSVWYTLCIFNSFCLYPLCHFLVIFASEIFPSYEISWPTLGDFLIFSESSQFSLAQHFFFPPTSRNPRRSATVSFFRQPTRLQVECFFFPPANHSPRWIAVVCPPPIRAVSVVFLFFRWPIPTIEGALSYFRRPVTILGGGAVLFPRPWEILTKYFIFSH
jgi:hypothetical protein